MKSLLTILLVLLGFGAAAAGQTAVTYDPTPLPNGPLVRRAPDFSKWQIDFYYTRASDKGGKASAPAPNLKDPAVLANMTQPKQLTVTRTKPLWHAVLLLANGSRRESWFDGAYRYEVHPENHSVVPIAQFNPGYNPAFLDYSSSDFPDIDWVSPQTYLGTQSGTIYWVFKQGDDDTMAWIDLTTRLPARWQNANEIRVFKFLPPPTEPLQLPPDVAALSAGLKRLQELSSMVPAHR